MNKYELGVIVRADLEDDTLTAEMERVKGFIDRFGGTIEKIDEWGRRKLAYPIAKQNEGIYTFITYSAEGDTAQQIEARLRLQENVLRFLTIRKDEDEAIAVTKPEEPVKAEVVSEEPQEEPAAETPQPAAEAEAAE